MLNVLIAGGFAGAVLWAAVVDLRSYRIPNRVSLALVVLFAITALTRDLAVPVHLLAGAIAFAAGLAAYRAGMVGGGDVKFLAAVALWAGPAWASLALALSLATILFTVVTVGARMTMGKVVSGGNANANLPRMLCIGERLPMAVPIAIAALVVLVREAPLFLGGVS